MWHLVFVVKYRRHVFDGPAIERLREIFADVCRDFEARLVEMDGEEDHVHLLVEYPPRVPVSGLVNSLKGVSSRLLRRGLDALHSRFSYRSLLLFDAPRSHPIVSISFVTVALRLHWDVRGAG